MNYKKIFKALLETNQLAVASAGTEQVFQLIVDSCAKLLNGNLAGLRLLSKDGKTHNTIAVFGWPKEMLGKQELTSGQGLAGWIMVNKKSSFCEDLLKESRFPVPEMVLKKGAKSVIGVPMIANRKVIGCLIVHFFKKRKFKKEEIDFLQTFANQAAQVIEQIKTIEERKQISNLFSRYVSPDVVNHLLKQRQQLKLEGDKKVIVVLFADIRKFTTLTLGKKPEEVISMLNAYFEPITEVILNQGGTIDKFIGDGIMAFWGAPIKHKDFINLAATAAILMQKKVSELISKKILPQEFKIGIGLNKGQVVVGDIGSTRRTEYTIIGETVNFASRLADVARGGEILMNEELAKSLSKKFKAEPSDIKKTRKDETFPFAVYRLKF